MIRSLQIRETAVQLLYCLHLEGGPDLAESSFDNFWHIFLDKDYSKLLTARMKTISHLTQDREERFMQFEEYAQKLLDDPVLTHEFPKLVELVNVNMEKERSWTAKLFFLKSASRHDAENKMGDFQLAIEDFFEFNGYSYTYRTMLLEAKPDTTKHSQTLDPLFAALKRLHRIGERILAVENPTQFPGNPDVSHLRTSEKNIKSLKEETNALAQNILSHISNIDETIALVVENFRPERIDPVDRAILRLGTYELLYRPDIHVAAVIAGAQDIAKKFSGSDSPRFIKGILNSIAKRYPNGASTLPSVSQSSETSENTDTSEA